MMLTRRQFSTSVVGGGIAAVAARDVHAAELGEFLPRGPTPTDLTEVFSNAISALAARRGGTLHLPAGTYALKRLTLRRDVVIEGMGKDSTVLSALPSSEEAFIDLGAGPVLNSGLRKLGLLGGDPFGPRNANQWAMKLTSSPAPSGKAHGGLWWSAFEDVAVRYFNRGFWFESGGDDYLLPHQFVSLRNVVLYGSRCSQGPGLRMTGQVNQFHVSQAHIDSWRDIGVEILKSPGGLTSPKLHHFDVVTIQGAKRAAVIDGAHNVEFSNCWFENNLGGLLVKSGSIATSVVSSRFANSGALEPAVTFEGETSGTVRGNVFAGPNTRQSIKAAQDAEVDVMGNSIIWGAKP